MKTEIVTQNPVHLNLNVRGLAHSATLAINEKSAEMQEKGLAVYRLGLGQSPFPVPERVVQALRDYAYEKDYLPVNGLRALRKVIFPYPTGLSTCSQILRHFVKPLPGKVSILLSNYAIPFWQRQELPCFRDMSSEGIRLN